MPIKFEKLDDNLRKLMHEEFLQDKKTDKLYFSLRISEEGQKIYDSLLENAILTGTAHSLAADFQNREVLIKKERRSTPFSGTIMIDVPKDAGITIAETEFNKYYIRALCRKAIGLGIPKVEVYNADAEKGVPPEYTKFVGKKIEAAALLDDLRANEAEHTKFGIPVPHTGLTIRF